MSQGNNTDKEPPVGTPIIAEFKYLQDCLVKIPVAIKPKDGTYYLKMPVRPKPEWQMNVLVKAIDFVGDLDITLRIAPNSQSPIWKASIIKREAETENSQIFQITKPSYVPTKEDRKDPRFFLLTPVSCIVNNNNISHKAVCMDISAKGLGVKMQGQFKLPEKSTFEIKFERPYDGFPELHAKMVRQVTNQLDNTTSFGLLLEKRSVVHMPQILGEVVEKHKQDAFKFSTGIKSKDSSPENKIFKLFE